MTKIINNLKAFNRKERFFLIGMALGNTEFRLSRGFRDAIEQKLHLNVPEDAFAAMDYHLDWIYASLFLALKAKPVQVHQNTNNLITATQEDIDFIIAFEMGNAHHLILLEAKGVMGFNNRQLASKAQRLKEIFGDQGKCWPGVVPHFAIVSPKEPVRLNTSDWPSWMKPDNKVRWIELAIPKGLKRLTRCEENGRPSNSGKWWKAV
ncbi:MAG: hypothetical protein ACE5IA_00305 [Dehalococcoidia bacterium]